jgi:hypothetical protein
MAIKLIDLTEEEALEIITTIPKRTSSTFNTYGEYNSKVNDDFVYCEIADSILGKTNQTISYNGDITIGYLTNVKSPKIETGAREYQREKVAPLSWKQQLMLTVIRNGFGKVPQIHIRVINISDGVFKLELIDGQQRVTSIIDFINNEYRLPNTSEFNLGNGIDVRNMSIEDIRETYPNLYNNILDYRISCLWYENLSDEQTADLFINVLNNTNAMKPQEIRNAVRGYLSQYIRNTSRFEDRHPLFERVLSDSKKGKWRLKHFSDGFTLNGRMEVDEWLSELIYLFTNNYRNGITQQKHTQWIKDEQTVNGRYTTEAQFKDFKQRVLDSLIKFSQTVITSVPSKLRYKLSPMLSQILILYGYELKNKYGTINIDTYVNKFFEIYDKWSNTKTKPYLNEFMWGTTDEQMEPFNKLFGGKNSKAIGTITYVLDLELKNDEDSFGVIEIDKRDFSKGDIIKKWEEQDRKCYYTNEFLDIKDIVGDHLIPRMKGVKYGGVTEYDNLVVTSKYLNGKKLNMSELEFKEWISQV